MIFGVKLDEEEEDVIGSVDPGWSFALTTVGGVLMLPAGILPLVMKSLPLVGAIE